MSVELRIALTDATRAVFEDLRAAHPADFFYGYALSVSPGSARVVASANTEEGLRRTAERLAENGYGDVAALAGDGPGTVRWRTEDWEHRNAGRAYLDAASDLAARVAEEGDARAVTAAVVGALRDLDRESFFGWGPERDSVVTLVLTGDPADLLELARDVNPAAPFARLQAALG